LQDAALRHVTFWLDAQHTFPIAFRHLPHFDWLQIMESRQDAPKHRITEAPHTKIEASLASTAASEVDTSSISSELETSDEASAPESRSNVTSGTPQPKTQGPSVMRSRQDIALL
jgi:hypothetical protein